VFNIYILWNRYTKNIDRDVLSIREYKPKKIFLKKEKINAKCIKKGIEYILLSNQKRI